MSDSPGPVRQDRTRVGEDQRSAMCGHAAHVQGGTHGAVDWDTIFRALDDQAAVPPPSDADYQSQNQHEVVQVSSSCMVSSDCHQVWNSDFWSEDDFGLSAFDIRPIPSRSQSYPNHNWADLHHEPTAPNLDPPFWSLPLDSPTTVDPRTYAELLMGSAFSASTSTDQTHSIPFRTLDQIKKPIGDDMLGRPRSHSTQHIPLQHAKQTSIGYTPAQNVDYSSVNPSPAPTSLSNPTSAEDSEDKRVRNTIASAKFRAKRKQQVATVQRTITDLEIQQAGLEADVASLRRENGLLKEMVHLKFGARIPER